MECLHCGDCCLRMSPKSAPDACPDLVKINGFYFCADYEHRPPVCRNHGFPIRYCPIGFEKTGCRNPQDVAQRIDASWEIITTRFNSIRHDSGRCHTDSDIRKTGQSARSTRVNGSIESTDNQSLDLTPEKTPARVS